MKPWERLGPPCVHACSPSTRVQPSSVTPHLFLVCVLVAAHAPGQQRVASVQATRPAVQHVTALVVLHKRRAVDSGARDSRLLLFDVVLLLRLVAREVVPVVPLTVAPVVSRAVVHGCEIW